MTVKLIAFDLDGTLLDDRKRLPAENLAALQTAERAGIILVPATGRILRGIPEELLETGMFRYFILSNGASVYDLGAEKRLFHAGIPTEQAVRICEYVDQFPFLYDCYLGENGYMTQWMYDAAPEYFVREPEILKLVRKLRIPVPELKASLLEMNEPPEKLQIYFRTDQIGERPRHMFALRERFPGLRVTYSLRNNIEINSAEAGKGNALCALCTHLGIDLSETVAFGDGLNDIDMIETAGCGVAMENADPLVIQKATGVAGNNNAGGVGKEILRLLKEDGQK